MSEVKIGDSICQYNKVLAILGGEGRSGIDTIGDPQFDFEI
ncbi:MAG: hypothetical protein ACFFEN_08065 [Candidatus Thorarchaeota archaeon]